ncbi:MAG: hypothetical protein P8N50_12295, partial [Actinomycetota bacterium]|nr:hypothetical protein [Actinomycetota bacterium]
MMTPLWRLDQLYSGLDDRQFMADEERFRAELSRAVSWFDREDIGEGDAFEPTVETVERAADALKSLNDLSAVQRKMRAYIHARVTTDARDDDAGSAYSRLLPASGDLMRLNGRFAAWVGRAAGPIDGDHTEVTAHREFIRQCSITAEHRMTDAEEDLALSLGLTGGTAWVRMRNDVAGRMTADVDGIDGPVPLAMVRG